MKKAALFWTVLFSLFLCACSDISGGGDDYAVQDGQASQTVQDGQTSQTVQDGQASQTDQAAQAGQESLSAGKAYLIVSVNENENASGARTIWPGATTAVTSLSNFALTGTYEGGPDVQSLAVWANSAQMSKALIPLDSGEWLFWLTAEGPSGTNYIGSAALTMSQSATQSVAFTLYPQGGSGSVQVTLTFPAGESVNYCKADLFKLDGTTSISKETKGPPTTATSYVYNAADVPAGTYILRFTLYADSADTANCVLCTYSTVVVVRGDCTTSGSIHADTFSSYTLTLDANTGKFGGTASTTAIDVPVKTTLQSIVDLSLAKTGYTFTKWNTLLSGSGTDYADGATLVINQNSTLYALWEPNQYTITLDRNGGTGGLNPNTIIATFDSVLPTLSSVPTYGENALLGYYTTASAGVQYYTWNGSPATDTGGNSLTYTVPNDITLYARWLEPKIYVSQSGSNTNDGLTPATAVATVTKALELLPTYVSGYHFATNCNWTIQVSGTVTDNANIPATLDTKLSSLNIIGTSGAILDGGANGSVLTIAFGKSIKIERLTIQNGKAANGGGINKTGTNEITIRNCTITGNTATANGGGIYNEGDKLHLYDSTVTSNTAVSGGGVYANLGSVSLHSGTINENTASGSGGGVYIKGASCKLYLEGGDIVKNSAGGGGGVYNCGKIEMSDGTISGNTATSNGGGITNSNGEITITGGTVGGSTEDDANTAQKGGGIYNHGANSTQYGKVTMSDGTISGNTASDCGGGIFNTSYARLTISGGTISGNTADSSTNRRGGGGIYNSSGATITMSAGTIKGNIARNDGGGVLNAGNFFMYGTAVIGDSTKSAPPASIDAASNRCLMTTDDGSGGGIFNEGKLYMGYSAAGTLSELSGGVFYNGGDGGGGVYNDINGNFYMASGTLNYNYGNWGGAMKNMKNFFMHGTAVIGKTGATSPATATSCGNYSNNVGGAMNNVGYVYLGYSDETTPADFTGGIFYNYARTNGGGIGDRLNGHLIQARAGTIAHNTAALNGSGIFYDCEDGFNFLEKFVVTSDNDIYLTSDAKIINVSGTLNPTANTVAGSPAKSATLTLSSYSGGRQVLSGATTTNNTKFALSEAGWEIDTDGKLKGLPATYTVKHMFQNTALNGYEAASGYADQTLDGFTGENTAAVAKTRTGFTAKAFSQQRVKYDGTTVVTIYYDRDKCKITVNTGWSNNTTTKKELTATYDIPLPELTTTNPPSGHPTALGPFSRVGYTLDGFYDAQSGGTKYYNNDGTSAYGKNCDFTTDKTLYARWTKGSAYTLISSGSTSGYTLSSGTYLVSSDLSFTNSAIQGNGIVISGTVNIYIEDGCTLTASGGPGEAGEVGASTVAANGKIRDEDDTNYPSAGGSGGTGGGAGILLTKGNTLNLYGYGTVTATGGKGGAAGNGGKNVQNAHMRAGDDNKQCTWGATGGGGGGGAGGGGAGIGTNGASGGTGGKGACGGLRTNSNWGDDPCSSRNAIDGRTTEINNGFGGGSGSSTNTTDDNICGAINKQSGITINATGGDGGAAGTGGTWHSTSSATGTGVANNYRAEDTGSGFSNDWTAGAGGAGGGGGAGLKGAGIGTGGAGAGGGGGGGGGSIYGGSNHRWCEGSGGNGGKGSTTGGTGGGGLKEMDIGSYGKNYGLAGAGGNAGSGSVDKTPDSL